MTELIFINWDKGKVELKSRKVRNEDKYIIEARVKEKEVKFKTKKIHKAKFYDGKIYYACKRAVGPLTKQQLKVKTNFYGRKITCENCRRFHKYKK